MSVEIGIIGLPQSGKTTICDMLANYRETPSPNYRPTCGCRCDQNLTQLEFWNLKKSSKGSTNLPLAIKSLLSCGMSLEIQSN